ncbi:MAG: hypothetical protein UBAL2_86920211 [Leptospirillum rubarum]|nr:MAG: hypothetical protein UBAL2_86920211 [Leptospirillum rubarum]
MAVPCLVNVWEWDIDGQFYVIATSSFTPSDFEDMETD